MNPWPKPLTCDRCHQQADTLAQYGGRLSVFAGSLNGPYLCDNCAPAAITPISFIGTVRPVPPATPGDTPT